MKDLKKRWKVQSSEIILDCRIFQVRKDGVLFTKKSPKPRDFFVLEGVSWCNVVPVLPNNKFLLVKQYRHGIRNVTIEFPAGLIDTTDKSPEDAGTRELLEETGYKAASSRVIGKVRPNPAIQTNWCYTILAWHLENTGKTDFDNFEDIEVIEASESEIEQMIEDGVMNHTLALNAWMFYQRLRDFSLSA